MNNPVEVLRREAPWLCEPALGVCIVGSQALASACRAAGIAGPQPGDVDLAWALAPDEGERLLREHGVFVATTAGNVDRGTLALKLDGHRIEITTFRGPDDTAPLAVRIEQDLAERDMTIGALAIELAGGARHDPFDGLAHWQQRRIVPVGDPLQRVHEHAVRWLRYYRKAHELGFAIEPSIRKLGGKLDARLLLSSPPEAIAQELRAMLERCPSPGRCLLDLYEDGVLATLSPVLASQFDGRPAGPQRWHPEVSQALHLILALEWAVAHTRELDERDRSAVLFAVLCHDLGKSDTAATDYPRHHGHEGDGVPHIQAMARRWPGLAEQRTVTLAKHVAALHLDVRRFDELRDGTLATMHDRYFRQQDYPLAAFALAVAADVAGRLGCEGEGEPLRRRVLRDLTMLREACSSVDAAALKAQHGDDLDGFRTALHQARAAAIRSRRSG